MKDLFIYLLKSGVVLSAFLLVYNAFLRSSGLFKFNRAFLLLGLLASAIIPSIKFTYETVLHLSPQLINTANAVNIIAPEKQFNIWQIVIAGYVAGLLIILLKDIFSLISLALLRKKSEITHFNGYKIVSSKHIKSPFSIFRHIFINMDELSDIERNLILKHEITHIEQRHYFDLLLGELILLTQWFNPFAWYYIYAQKENHEFLADNAVISSGESSSIYKAVLINQRFQKPIFSFSNGFKLKKYSSRLSMIEKSKNSKVRVFSILSVLFLTLIFVFYFWATAEARIVIKENSTGNNANMLASNDTIIGKVKDINDNNNNARVILSGRLPGLDTSVNNNEHRKEGAISRAKVTNPPLVIIDNKETSIDALAKLATNKIADIIIIKDEDAIAKYGDKAKYGVIIITSRDKIGGTNATESNVNKEEINTSGDTTTNKIINSNSNSENSTDKPVIKIHGIGTTKPVSKTFEGKSPLIIIDDKETNMDEFYKLSPNEITDVKIIKAEDAIVKYGDKAKHGAIIVTSKKN